MELTELQKRRRVVATRLDVCKTRTNLLVEIMDDTATRAKHANAMLLCRSRLFAFSGISRPDARTKDEPPQIRWIARYMKFSPHRS